MGPGKRSQDRIAVANIAVILEAFSSAVKTDHPLPRFFGNEAQDSSDLIAFAI